VPDESPAPEPYDTGVSAPAPAPEPYQAGPGAPAAELYDEEPAAELYASEPAAEPYDSFLARPVPTPVAAPDPYGSQAPDPYQAGWVVPSPYESPSESPYESQPQGQIPEPPYVAPTPYPPPNPTPWLGPRRLVDLWDRLDYEQPLQFDAVVQAHAAAIGLYPALGDIRAEANELRRMLRHAFASQHGAVVSQYLCSHRVVGGAALTEGAVHQQPGRIRRQLHTVLTTSDGDLLELEDRANALTRDAVTVFADRAAWVPQMRRCTDEIYAAMTHVLHAAEQEDDAERAAATESARKEMGLTSDRVQVLIQRQSRFSYFGGTFAGAALAIGLVVLLAFADRAWWSHQVAAGPFLAAGMFGAFGAVASVFGRIAGSGLIIDYTAGLWQKRLLGGLRSVVGALLGIAAHFVLVGGVLGGQLVTGNARTAFAFFALVGFAAGFTERFATDLIERAGQLVGGGTSSSGASSGSPPPG
jgi:hypothetical protein